MEWSESAVAVATSVATTIATLAVTKGGGSILRLRKFAFTLQPGIGQVWHLTKISGRKASDVEYRIVAADSSETRTTAPLPGGSMEVGTAYGVDSLVPGDTFEVYWREGRHQRSTSQMILTDQRVYQLRRENTGH
ncbi:hypothetical protein [Rathayibacter sp. AY1A3]|uniref:hypothetical protein n=1 Tax=Rathayibacter sp. AY1A3 TaxID=2080521 RepID=UPI0011B0669F|nr:hypothetical protein [Rathayibacter sp. AY1A3]